MEFWTCPACSGVFSDYTIGALDVSIYRHIRTEHDGDETLISPYLTANDIRTLKSWKVLWTAPADYPPEQSRHGV